MRFDSANRIQAVNDGTTRSRERVFAWFGLISLRQVMPAFMISLVLVLLPASGTLAQPTDDATVSATSAVAWLQAQQADDGGFLGFSGESDPSATADAVMALAAASSAGIAVDLSGALAYLKTAAPMLEEQGPGAAAKLTVALVAAGADPTDVNGVNPLAIVEAAASDGLIGDDLYDHALGILALAAAGSPVPPEAVEAFRSTQSDDGLWAFDGSLDEGAGDTNTTALAVQALVAAGETEDAMVADAVVTLISVQNDDGGFPYLGGEPSDANSTALVIQALIATGGDTSGDVVQRGLAALAGFQNESGAFHFMDGATDDNLFATVQAIPALVGVSLPVTTPAPVATPEAI